MIDCVTGTGEGVTCQKQIDKRTVLAQEPGSSEFWSQDLYMRKERTDSRKLCSELCSLQMPWCGLTYVNRCDFKMFLRGRCIGRSMGKPGASGMLENVRLRGSGIVH